MAFSGSATPGESNYRFLTDVAINEVLTHATLPLENTVELRNLTGGSVDIGGWFLSDSATVPKKFRLANGTTLATNGFALVLESQFNTGGTNAFTLDRARGGELWLSAADAGTNLTGFRTRVKFGAAEDGVSFGRFPVGGDTAFAAQSARTFGAANSGPLVGPVVIHEIMYHPPGGVAGATEFIELRNITGTPVDLFDPARPTNTWRLGDGIDFSFPPSTTLAANGYLLVVDFDPVADAAALASFRAHYAVSPAVPVFGPFTGQLNNGGETIELFKPDLPDGAFVPSVRVDKVSYRDSAPWPSGADGTGLSLQRRAASAYGNDAANWLAALPTAGGANNSSAIASPVIVQSPGSTNVFVNADVFLQAAATGSGPLAWQWRFNGHELSGATNASLYLEFLQNEDAGVYDVYAVNPGGPTFSAPAQVSVVQPPFVISGPPATYGTNGGSNVTFTVLAGGTGPFTYQWRFNGTDIPGATTPNYSLTNLVINQSGVYTLALSNIYGGTNVNTTLLVLIKPVITNHITGQTVLQGGTAVFTVLAGPDHPFVPLWYRWIRNGSGIATTAVPVLVLTNVQVSATIRVVVTNAASPTGTLSPTAGTVPLTMLADFDHDGIADLWEVQYGFNTNNAADALFDFDGDGMNNRDEYLAGTNPTNALSVLKLVLTATNANVLQFLAQSNVSYSVQARTNLSTALWTNLTNIGAQPGVRTIQVNTAVGPPLPQNYYRVVTPLVP